MKTGKLKKFETVAAPLVVADSPEELAAFIGELVAIGEKLPSAGASGETLADIIADYKKPRSIIVNDVKGNRVLVRDGVTKIISGGSEKMDANFVTKHNSSDAEKILSSGVTKFDKEELLILEQIQNAEQ
jgi:hypothetical protein